MDGICLAPINGGASVDFTAFTGRYLSKRRSETRSRDNLTPKSLRTWRSNGKAPRYDKSYTRCLFYFRVASPTYGTRPAMRLGVRHIQIGSVSLGLGRSLNPMAFVKEPSTTGIAVKEIPFLRVRPQMNAEHVSWVSESYC